MELRLVLLILRRWILFVILGVALGVGLGYAYAYSQTPLYETSATVLIVGEREDPSDSTARRTTSTDELVRTYTQLLQTRSLLQTAGDELGYTINAGSISVEPVPQTKIFKIKVRHRNPERAAEIANRLIEVLIEENDKLQLARFNASARGLENQIDTIESEVQGIGGEINRKVTTEREDLRGEIESNILVLEVDIANTEREILNMNAEWLATPEPIFDEEGEEIEQDPPVLTLEQQSELTAAENQLATLKGDLEKFRQTAFELDYKIESTDASGSDPELGQLRTQLDLYQGLYSNLVSDYEAIRIATLNETPSLARIDSAVTPNVNQPISPSFERSMAIGGILGFILISSLAFLIEYMDDAIKSDNTVNGLLKLPVIGHTALVNDMSGNNLIYASQFPRSPFAESIRKLRTNLEFVEVDNDLKTILVTSANPSEGKTSTAVNLASTMAQAGQKVILVDSDLRRPTLHHYFDTPNQVGLTNVLVEHILIQDALYYDERNKFYVLTSGSIPPNPSELLRTNRMTELLQELGNMADAVIIDAPPFLVADPSILAAQVDGVLLVLRHAKTREQEAIAVVDQLNRAKARVLGVVLNGINVRSYKEFYYHQTYYGYEENRPKRSRSRRFGFGRRKPRKIVNAESVGD